VANDYTTLPGGLPVPEDDGAADHLPGAQMPDLSLPSTSGGDVNLNQPGTLVLYLYPRTGKPDEPLLPGWDDIPGARGCTPESCAFRDLNADVEKLGAHTHGLSAQSLEDQHEFAERVHLPYAIISDPQLELATALNLPTFQTAGLTLYKRLTLIARDGTIEKVFYPVFPPDTHAEEVVAALERMANV
jgi:peroxiredoxin